MKAPIRCPASEDGPTAGSASPGGPGSEESLPVELGLGREDRLELGRKLGMLGAHSREPGVARFGRDLEYLIEQPVQQGDGRGIACHMAA